MNTTFDPWLRQLAAAGKGPAALHIDRGLPFSARFVLNAPFPGATVSASLKLRPDAAGAALAAFTASAVTVEGDYSAFTLSLTDSQTAALPADDDGDGLAQVAFDVLFTPAGGTLKRLFGGVATIAGKVSA